MAADRDDTQALLVSRFYGDERLRRLRDFVTTVDSMFAEEAERFATELRGVDDELGQFFTGPFPETLHSSLAVAAVIVLENQIRWLFSMLKQELSLPLSLGALRGSLVERFRNLLQGVAWLDLRELDSHWSSPSGVIELRNCIVHPDGVLGEMRKPEILRGFLEAQGLDIIDYGRLRPSRESSLRVLEVVQQFFDATYGVLIAMDQYA
jgi:hypothetical protein